MLKGIDITLYTKTQTGEDRFHAPIYEETPVTVHNVLVGEPSSEAVVTELQLTGRRIAYTLALPQGRRPRLEQCPGGVLGPDFLHRGRGRAGHRIHGASGLEQESAGGTD